MVMESPGGITTSTDQITGRSLIDILTGRWVKQREERSTHSAEFHRGIQAFFLIEMILSFSQGVPKKQTFILFRSFVRLERKAFDGEHQPSQKYQIIFHSHRIFLHQNRDSNRSKPAMIIQFTIKNSLRFRALFLILNPIIADFDRFKSRFWRRKIRWESKIIWHFSLKSKAEFITSMSCKRMSFSRRRISACRSLPRSFS